MAFLLLAGLALWVFLARRSPAPITSGALPQLGALDADMLALGVDPTVPSDPGPPAPAGGDQGAASVFVGGAVAAPGGARPTLASLPDLNPATVDLSADRARMKQLAWLTAEKYKLDPKLFTALVVQESSVNPRAVSSEGAYGLTQLMPGTAAGMGYSSARLQRSVKDQLEGGARYLRAQLDRFGGSWTKALAAYNAGPGNVPNGAWASIPETVDYIRSIAAIYSKQLGGNRWVQ